MLARLGGSSRLADKAPQDSTNNLGQRYSFSSYLLIQIALLDAKTSVKRWCTRVATLHPAFRAATEQETGTVGYQLLFPGLLFILFNGFSVKYVNCTGTNMHLETGIKCAFSKKILRKSECLDATGLNLKAFYFTAWPPSQKGQTGQRANAWCWYNPFVSMWYASRWDWVTDCIDLSLFLCHF